jgi:hypothetical protein
LLLTILAKSLSKRLETEPPDLVADNISGVLTTGFVDGLTEGFTEGFTVRPTEGVTAGSSFSIIGLGFFDVFFNVAVLLAFAALERINLS